MKKKNKISNNKSIMSNSNKFLTVLSVLALTVFIASCVNDDDYNLPDLTINEPNIPSDKITTFEAVKSRLEQAQANGDDTAIIGLDEELYIEGYVVSSDRSGNYFEELIIQNKIDDSNPTNDPRLGFRISINVASLSDTYEFGRRVIVNLSGLTIGEANGVIVIGKGDGSDIGQIQAFEYKDFILRTPEVATITPKIVSISELTEADENTYIQLNDVQINRNELDKTFAGEPDDEFDGFRTIESCENSSTIILQTSTFADFKSLQVPQLKGSIKGIFSRDFRDDFNVLIINSTSDIVFDNNERCDPIELSCGIASSQGTNNLFADNFETQIRNAPISGNGWTNYIQSGTEGWEAYSATGSNASLGISARVGSFRSNDVSTIAWLITPAINLDAQENETLVFKTSNSFSDGSNMEVLLSTDWDGTESGISTATWGVLTDAYITQDSDSFSSWFDSGIVNLSCVSGTVYIAFKYTGSGEADFDGTYELDDISIDF
ncbi:DUF5689 domain-containing protein [Litoribaculum gwangyangense]|uniref:DUF5689 domain-containing protein n=1 Tax=Litoribaculum gwangyangense TaxID=1130722 RepID=A0ABP9C5H8_9FLAO